MADKNTHDSTNGTAAGSGDGPPVTETDGGTVTQAAQDHRDTNYLDREVNILKPSTPFMREHLKVVWTGFLAWFLIVFGPPTATFLAPDTLSVGMPVLGFPLHYFLIAIGGPTGALLLAFWYSRKRDALDRKYGIHHADEPETTGSEDVAAADGGVDR
ncbi:DUF4212 domain-containing protein [Halorientalis halophila]|uniref:DUF4212 domain-containing protein n=1 Tax=Halorientalis halophila TaxID=3108499 RepID=UPI003008E44C